MPQAKGRQAPDGRMCFAFTLLPLQRHSQMPLREPGKRQGQGRGTHLDSWDPFPPHALPLKRRSFVWEES